MLAAKNSRQDVIADSDGGAHHCTASSSDDVPRPMITSLPSGGVPRKRARRKPKQKLITQKCQENWEKGLAAVQDHIGKYGSLSNGPSLLQFDSEEGLDDSLDPDFDGEDDD